MSCTNQVLEAGQGAATATTFTPTEITFPYDETSDLRLDIYNYEDQQWVNVPLATGATIDVGGAGDRFYAWETYLDNGVTGVRTILATASTTPALPAGGTASHPLAPANNNYPVVGGAGANVRLYRMTSIEAGQLPAYFYPGASIKAEDLNDNFEALRKVVEESSCATDNVSDATPQLDARYWNKVNVDDGGDIYTSTSTSAWPNNDVTIVTTAAGDDRWLNATGGNVIGGDGVTVTESGGNITISVDNGNGLNFDGGTPNQLQVDAGNGIIVDANGVSVDAHTGITVDANGVSQTTLSPSPAGTYTTANITVDAMGRVTAASTGSGGGGGGQAEVLADVAALNAQVPSDGDLYLILDSTGLNASAASGDNDKDVNGLPMTEGAGGPVGGYSNQIQVTVEWDNGNDRWQYIRYANGTPDARYVLEQGDTMTGPLILDDTSLQIQEGADTLTITWPTGTAARAITFPDASGVVSLVGQGDLDTRYLAVTGDTATGTIIFDPSTAGNNAIETGTGHDVYLGQDSNVVFEGATANDFETTLTVTDPTADRTITFPDATGTVALSGAGPVDARYVAVAGDTMTGNLVMDTANITGDSNAITAGAGNWDLNDGNFWTLGAITVPTPTNMAEGISGLIINTAAATWPAAGGATFQYAGNTPPNITEFPATIPFYCVSATEIFIGTPTVNIT
jgi:hypothetical protein